MSLAEEKKLVKEIEQLKQSKKTAAQYVSQEEVRVCVCLECIVRASSGTVNAGGESSKSLMLWAKYL